MPQLRKMVPPELDPPVMRKDPFAREQAIQTLLAQGMTLADIQHDEEEEAAEAARIRVRARYWTKPAPYSTRQVRPTPAPPPPSRPPPRTPSPKVRYRVTNWPAYNAALKARASLTIWLDPAVLTVWRKNERVGKVGAPTYYADQTITMLLTLRSVFRLALRQTQGFAQSILTLIDLDMPVPDYSTLCRRARHLAVALPHQATGPIHLVVDSTGLKLYGEGEWKVRQHDTSTRRTWRKLHLGIDASTGEIVAAVVTTADVGDCEVLPDLLAAIPDPLAAVGADGAYDTIGCHQAIAARQATAIIPPRVNALITDVGWWDAREDAVRRVREIGLAAWKRETGYHRRSLAETGMYRMKQIFGDHIASRILPTQRTEARIRCAALNRMTALGMPTSEVVTA